MLRYQESAPPPALVPFVLSFWEFRATGQESPPPVAAPLSHEVFPDGCITLTFYRDPSDRVSWLRVVGPTLRSFRTEVKAGDTFWGARLQPAAGRAVIGRESSSLRDQMFVCEEVNPALAAELMPRLAACHSYPEAAAAFADGLCQQRPSIVEIDDLAAAAARHLINSGGEVKISDLAAAIGLSARQLQRRFQLAVGLTPKQFARARRIRAAAVKLVQTETPNWAGIAAEVGFADQAHLIHEFASVTGDSPTVFAHGVRRIDHGELVE